MNDEFYGPLAETAFRLLTEYGRSVTLRKFTPGGGGKYDPSTARAVSNSQTAKLDKTRQAIVVDAPANRIGSQYGSSVKEGTLIQEFNKWCYMDANGAAPTNQDHIIVGSKTYKIFNVQEYAPGGIPLMYLVVLRA
jgi:hypothetical protein